MQKPRISMAMLTAVLAMFLIIPFSAFTFAPNVTNPTKHPPAPHRVHKILPGQELVFPYPLKNDPKATVHIKMNKVKPSSSNCDYGIWEEEDLYNVYGGTLASYRITINFCYDGTHVTYISNPPNESWYTCCFWSLGSHSAYTHEDPTHGLAHGSFTFNGPFQSFSGWVEIDVYGDGSWYGSAS
jgi:hypothetical protein